MSTPERILAWPWEVNPNMGQWETQQTIWGEGAEYIRADAVAEMIRQAVQAEREACAKVCGERGVENNPAASRGCEADYEASLQSVSLAQAAKALAAADGGMMLALAHGFDREDSAQRGEPDPHDGGLFPVDWDWKLDRIACARAGLAELISTIEKGEA